jgi:hypothetical protein
MRLLLVEDDVAIQRFLGRALVEVVPVRPLRKSFDLMIGIVNRLINARHSANFRPGKTEAPRKKLLALAGKSGGAAFGSRFFGAIEFAGLPRWISAETNFTCLCFLSLNSRLRNSTFRREVSALFQSGGECQTR